MSSTPEDVKQQPEVETPGDQTQPRVTACDDYKVNKFLGTWLKLKGLITLPVKLLPFLILHTLDPILFLLNILTLPFPRANPSKQHKWTLADRLLAKSCELSGWGKITDSEKQMILSALNNFSAPGEEDSRSPCPGLNAMANHGKFGIIKKINCNKAIRFHPTSR